MNARCEGRSAVQAKPGGDPVCGAAAVQAKGNHVDPVRAHARKSFTSLRSTVNNINRQLAGPTWRAERPDE